MRNIKKLIVVGFTAILVSCTETKPVEAEAAPAAEPTQTEVGKVETKAP